MQPTFKNTLLASAFAMALGGCKTITALNQVGVFDSGLGEGAAEIVSFDDSVGKAFVVNAKAGTVDVLVLGKDGSLPDAAASFTIDVTMASNTLRLGNANSVDAQDGILAVAIENDDKQANGVVAFYRTDNYDLLNTVEVGALPDMVKFTPNGRFVVVANEGEPSDDYRIDPQGSVSIIYIDRRNRVASPRHYLLDFNAFNPGGPRHDELPEAVRIFGPGASVAQDLEPEYIAVAADSKTAWVSFQENNALAEIDLRRKRVRRIVALGFKDHRLPGNELDASNRDGAINIRNWPVLGMYQPDAIDAYQTGGRTYLVSANEGDARDYQGFSEEVRVADLTLDNVVYPDSSIQNDDRLGRLKTTTLLGDANSDGFVEQIYSYGARSFSIWDSLGNLVYDSGADIAKITADALGLDLENETGFNGGDQRSDDKGAEPEAVVVGYVQGRYYAFVGLERTGGIMVYDITDPEAAEFVLYFDEGPGHVSPEGLEFVPASKSPTGKALLLVAHEISGTTTVYEIETDFDSNL